MLRKLIQRPIAVTMALLSVAVLGLVSINLLPVSLVPDVDIPYITVQVSAPKLSARQIEESVMRPLRQQLMQIDGVEDMACTSKDATGTIKLSFNYSSNIDFLFIEVNERVDRAMPYLPEIQRPKVIKASAADIPAFYINITLAPGSTSTFSDLCNFAVKVINRRIEQLPQVAMADMSGHETPQIVVVPNREKLISLGIDIDEFEEYVRAADVRLGTLTITDGEYSYDVKFESLALGREAIEDIVVNKNGKLIKLSDIAQIVSKPAPRNGYVFSDSKPALSVAVIKQKNAKMSALRKGMEELMQEFEKDYPDIDFEVTRNQTQLLDYSINSLAINILLAIILSSGCILLFFRELKTSALVIVVIPASLVFSLLLFYLFGLSLNTLSLSGLLLGVGMMVDNTIILLDNITSWWKRGLALEDAVVYGTKEVRGAMLSSLLTTCVVFVPVMFISGIAGALFSDQAAAITITLITSYLITITIVPVYYYWWYRKQVYYKPATLRSWDITAPMLKWERRIMEKALRLRHYILPLLLLSMVGCIAMFLVLKKERLPHITYNECIAEIDWNSQISIEQNRARVEEIEKLIEQDEEQVTSMIGVQQFVLGHTADLSVSETSIYIKSSKGGLDRIKSSISAYLASNYPQAVCLFKESGNVLEAAFGERQALLTARLRSANSSLTDIPTLKEVLGKINEVVPLSSRVRLKKDILYIADPAAMALYNVSYNELLHILRGVLSGNTLFEIVQGEQILPVIVADRERNLSQIISESVISHGNVQIPLRLLLKQTFREDFQVITSGIDGEYYPADLSVAYGEVASVMDRIKKIVQDSGEYTVSFSGAWFSNNLIAKELFFAFIIALIMLYIILAAQFESLLQPLIILSEIVVDTFAILLAMWAIGVSVNVMSLIGLVVVSGIVINDSILKVDTINRLIKSGMDTRQAIMEAGERRMKSIVMTSITTILAVAPFLKRGSIGDDMQFPMSVVIIVGMAVGTLISLFMVPALYSLLYNKKTGSR